MLIKQLIYLETMKQMSTVKTRHMVGNTIPWLSKTREAESNWQTWTMCGCPDTVILPLYSLRCGKSPDLGGGFYLEPFGDSKQNQTVINQSPESLLLRGQSQ